MARYNQWARGWGRRAAWKAVAPFLILGTALVVATAACGGGILDVSLPGDVQASDLKDPSLASTLVLGAQNDFECGFGDFVLSTGVWDDELVDASTWASPGNWQTRRPTSYDTGTSQCATQLFRGSSFAPYLPLQTARVQAKTAFQTISAQADDLPNKQKLLATASAYQGLSTLVLGENYCQVRLDPDSALLDPAAAEQRAADILTTSITDAQAAGADDILNLARILRARALTDLGQNAEAKTLADAVPAGFEYDATYAASPERRANWVNAYNNVNLFVSVDPRYHDLEVDGTPDPRVPVTYHPEKTANDGVTEMWIQGLYPDLSSPIPLATWQEARLIVAEADVAAGDGPGAVDAINDVRDMYGLPDYASSDLSAIMDQVKEERRRTLFLQGRRLGDMLRFGIPLDQGFDARGRSYSAGVDCLPVPQAEL